MQYELDKENATHCMMFDSVYDILSSTERKFDNGVRNYSPSYGDSEWIGRELSSWDDVKDACFNPSPEALEAGSKLVQKILDNELPQPKSKRRKAYWNDSGGSEIGVGRYMDGEPFWRSSRREMKTGTSTVSVITNLDGISSESSESMMWRGAGAVAIADVLENAGYNVDLHVWCRGSSVYDETPMGQFTSINIKSSGDVLDVGAIMSVLTGWFLRSVIYSSFNTAGVGNRRLGSPVETLGSLSSYMALESDRIVYMPIVRSEKGAVGAVNRVLEEFTYSGDSDMSVSEWEEWAGHGC